jgi:TatD DNase family protein
VLIDAHAHLDLYGPEDLPRALAELVEHRTFTVAVSMDPASYARTKMIAGGEAYSKWVLPTFGIHPVHGAEWADRLNELDDLIAESPMLGEIGLDFHWVEDEAAYPRQRRTFEYLLQAARDQDKIVNLHTKGAEAEIVDRLSHYGLRRAIVHWYSGPVTPFNALVEHGAYFTVGVEVLYSDKIRTIARRIPPDQLLTETDNPGGWAWLNDPDDPDRGERGMPHHLQPVIDALAEIRGITRDEVIATVQANLLRLFGDDPRLAAAADVVRAG